MPCMVAARMGDDDARVYIIAIRQQRSATNRYTTCRQRSTHGRAGHAHIFTPRMSTASLQAGGPVEQHLRVCLPACSPPSPPPHRHTHCHSILLVLRHHSATRAQQHSQSGAALYKLGRAASHTCVGITWLCPRPLIMCWWSRTCLTTISRDSRALLRPR
eukprot:365121-Chlamydomonas_euryale.AAC.9